MTPVNPSLLFHSRATEQMGRLRMNAERLQQQLATGDRLARPSDDPAAAAGLRRIARAEQLSAAAARNAERAQADLALADNALQAVGSDLLRLRELAGWAANGTLSSEGRAAIGREVAALRSSILGSVNARGVDGIALFGGQSSGPAYLITVDGTATYQGGAETGDIPLEDGQSIGRGVTAPMFLRFPSGGAQVDLPDFLQRFAASLEGGTADPASGTALATFDDALHALGRAQALIGARLDWLGLTADRRLDAVEARAERASDLGGVDIAETAARLQQTLTVLEASQAGFARVARLSLFDNL